MAGDTEGGDFDMPMKYTTTPHGRIETYVPLPRSPRALRKARHPVAIGHGLYRGGSRKPQKRALSALPDRTLIHLSDIVLKVPAEVHTDSAKARLPILKDRAALIGALVGHVTDREVQHAERC
jgi:hypothetical protein